MPLPSGFEDRRCALFIGRKKECFFPFGVLYIASCSAADQLSSFRVACVADRISSRNKLKFF